MAEVDYKLQRVPGIQISGSYDGPVFVLLYA